MAGALYANWQVYVEFEGPCPDSALADMRQAAAAMEGSKCAVLII